MGQKPPHLYHMIYLSTRFERCGLFALLQELFSPREVLYAGSGVHITPSFYFPHVIYLDQSQQARQFFAELQPLRRYIETRKIYRRSTFVAFEHADFTLRHHNAEKVEMLITLFAGPTPDALLERVKPGGVVVTDFLPGPQNNMSARGWEHKGTIDFTSGRYRFSPAPLGNAPEARPHTKQKRYLRNVSGGAHYIEEQSYAIFSRG